MHYLVDCMPFSFLKVFYFLESKVKLIAFIELLLILRQTSDVGPLPYSLKMEQETVGLISFLLVNLCFAIAAFLFRFVKRVEICAPLKFTDEQIHLMTRETKGFDQRTAEAFKAKAEELRRDFYEESLLIDLQKEGFEPTLCLLWVDLKNDLDFNNFESFMERTTSFFTSDVANDAIFKIQFLRIFSQFTLERLQYFELEIQILKMFGHEDRLRRAICRGFRYGHSITDAAFELIVQDVTSLSRREIEDLALALFFSKKFKLLRLMEIHGVNLDSVKVRPVTIHYLFLEDGDLEKIESTVILGRDSLAVFGGKSVKQAS